MGSQTAGGRRVLVHQKVYVGTKGAKVVKGKVIIPKLAIGALYHELGHAAHQRAAFEPSTQKVIVKHQERGFPFGYYETARFEQEKIAWKIGRESITQMQRPAPVMWLKRFALESYKRTSGMRRTR